MEPKCCWNCRKANIISYLNEEGLWMSCPVTGGIIMPVTETVLKEVETGCTERTCFEPKEATK